MSTVSARRTAAPARATVRLARAARTALCVALLATAWPLHAALFDDDEARRQIAEEKRRVTELQNQVQKQNQDLSARLGRLEEAMKSQALLELLAQIEALKLDMNRLRGQIELLGNNIELANKRQKDMYTDIDARMRRLEQPVVPAAGATGAPGQAAATSADAMTAGKSIASAASVPAAPPAAESPAEMRAYEAAQNLRKIGNYQGSIIAFQSFVKQYPRSTLASSAQYWIGDSYFNLRDYRLAILNQQQLIKAYPDSQKVPDAMLNIASAQFEMGESIAAKKTMEEIVVKYPVSDAADKAKRRLATLK